MSVRQTLVNLLNIGMADCGRYIAVDVSNIGRAAAIPGHLVPPPLLR